MCDSQSRAYDLGRDDDQENGTWLNCFRFGCDIQVQNLIFGKYLLIVLSCKNNNPSGLACKIAVEKVIIDPAVYCGANFSIIKILFL